MKPGRAHSGKIALRLGLWTLLCATAHSAPLNLYFNHNNQSSFQDQTRNFKREGDDFEKIVIEKIKNAKSRLWIAVFNFDLTATSQALIKAHNRGVDVRVMIQKAALKEEGFTIFSLGSLNQVTEDRFKSPAVLRMRKAGIVIRDNSQGDGGNGLMHHKFMIVDESTLVTGSANFTDSDFHGDIDNPDTRGNANSLLVFESQPLNHIFEEEFSYMWGTGQGNTGRFGQYKPNRPAQETWIENTKITVQFSPGSGPDSDDDTKFYSPGGMQDTVDMIGNLLLGAKKSVNFSLFVFSHQGLANNLFDTYNKTKISIRGLIDPGFISRDYSEALDMWGIQMPNANCEYEKGNNPWPQALRTVGSPSLPRGDKLHHKFAVIDNQITVTGSHNWSASAEFKNDEAVLIIESPEVAASYNDEFNRLPRKNTYWGPSKTLLQSIKDRKKECGL